MLVLTNGPYLSVQIGELTGLQTGEDGDQPERGADVAACTATTCRSMRQRARLTAVIRHCSNC